MPTSVKLLACLDPLSVALVRRSTQTCKPDKARKQPNLRHVLSPSQPNTSYVVGPGGFNDSGRRLFRGVVTGKARRQSQREKSKRMRKTMGAQKDIERVI